MFPLFWYVTKMLTSRFQIEYHYPLSYHPQIQGVAWYELLERKWKPFEQWPAANESLIIKIKIRRGITIRSDCDRQSNVIRSVKWGIEGLFIFFTFRKFNLLNQDSNPNHYDQLEALPLCYQAHGRTWHKHFCL